ncbi:MAG TPA: ATP-binding cassette domain-containing protein, partial [Gemmatimonadales bacterium]|nr:ATP-binding cassette domain-containing protein [Gemmatimonadales bacterium]
MTLVALSSVTVQYGAEPLLDNVNLAVEPGERWGLIGRNGTGKSSLFRILAGAQEPSGGALIRSPGLRVALLDQHRDFGTAETVWDAACTGFADLLALEHALHQQAVEIGRLGDRVGADRLARYDRDLERFGREGGYGMEARVSAVLQG